MKKRYRLVDESGNVIDTLPVVINRLKLQEFVFVFTDASEWGELTSAETRALLLAILNCRKGNIFYRSDLANYYSPPRLTQVLQILRNKGLIKRLSYGEYMISPYLCLKGPSDSRAKMIQNWEGDSACGED